mmetsp:Transcript_17750/g.26928  ORF Transcript_17750/g.26928 Transcript_17750/m.26928 type:complete len:106 (+) Transcript_17750:520-837(+)
MLNFRSLNSMSCRIDFCLFAASRIAVRRLSVLKDSLSTTSSPKETPFVSEASFGFSASIIVDILPILIQSRETNTHGLWYDSLLSITYFYLVHRLTKRLFGKKKK